MNAPDRRLETLRLPIGGMTCTSCVARITRALRRVPGVEHVTVDLRGERAILLRDPARADDAAIAAAVRNAGYEPDLAAATQTPADEETPSMLTRLLGALRPGRLRALSGSREPTDQETPR